MSLWVNRILKEFPEDISRFWIAADPDDVLLDEQVLAGLRELGFELLPYEDPIAFRAEYEERYRSAWYRGEAAPAKALVLHLRGNNVSDLPWDYLHLARQVSLSLADLFPSLSYPVVQQIGAEHLAALFEAQTKHVSQTLGESATKEFVLTHIFKISPHLISRPEDLWHVLLKLHFRGYGLPLVLAVHVENVLREHPEFRDFPISELFVSKSLLLRVVQDAWYRFLAQLGFTGSRTGEPLPLDYKVKIEIPFEHPDVRVLIDTMFLDGLLHPLVLTGVVTNLPEWAKVGVVEDPQALGKLVAEGIKGCLQSMPTQQSSYRDWVNMSRRYSEVIARFHDLESQDADKYSANIAELQASCDESLQLWITKHYADLPSLPVAKGPVMVHHVPRFLSLKRGLGETKIALLVFDGLAVDQWIQIREALAKRAPTIGFDESTCFAWLPTLTSVSRQAIFSGLKPREFPETIDSTSAESNQWSRFWQDQGLRTNEVLYRKGIKRRDQLAALETDFSAPSIKVAGIVVDMVDEIVHGAMLGKRGIATQIRDWCKSGFVDQLLESLLANNFHIYITADHGNVEAIGQGRPSQGLSPEIRGERVRTYRSEELVAESASQNSNTFRLEISGLPENFMPLFSSRRTAFLQQGEPAVVHGGISIEELIVPFVKVVRI